MRPPLTSTTNLTTRAALPTMNVTATASASIALNDDSPTMCLYITGHDWDHYLLFALTEINSGLYTSTLGDDIQFQHKILYANPSSLMVEGEAQKVFETNYKSCHLFIGPAFSTQLAAIGEWAGLEQKPIVSGGASLQRFSQANFGYVSRSIPSEQRILEAFVQIIVEYELPLINIVYFNDEFGRSGAEALIEMAQGKFEVQLLRTFDSKDDVEGINSVLDDLENSPTYVTYLSMTFLPLADFLNIAGRRGMHSSHLWLSPTATQVADKLDPPPTGGIWGVSYGEELKEDSPLAQRYLAKDPTLHIEAMQYGMNDEYDTLTYWGAYAYDAVLAAAHGLAAATNRSDGEEVLKEIRALSLDNANTGLLEMDENGDRIGARIPIFFLTPEGTSEQFAVYQQGTVDFLQDPVWPDVKSSGDQSVSIGGIMAILFAVLLVGSTILFIVYRRKDRGIIESQQMTIRENTRMLEQKDKELAFKLGTSKFGDAVNFIDSLLKTDNPQIGPNDLDKLILVKSCLTSGSDDKAMHVPNNLSESYRDLFLLKEFAGIDKPRGLVKQGKFRKLTLLTKSTAAAPVEDTLDCLTEFISLDVKQQSTLFEILSFPNLRQWCFNIFDVSAIDEVNTLLFVAWAILGSPHSQFAMAKELGRDVALDDFEGYDFLGMGLSVEMSTLINYIRVIQRDYNDTPYHNAIHAADVVQTMHSMIQMAGENLFKKEEMFTIILAAVVHDVKHPGFNNNFQVNSISSLALTHNDSAVLENEHASHAFKVLVKGVPGEYDNLNFLGNSDVSDFSEFRRKVMSAVLHTDMSNHFSTVAKMKNLAVGRPWDQMDSNLRWEILSFMLHLSDISNPAKEDPMTKLWTDRCLEEFFHQGDKELELGLPISLNCCRKETKKPDSQIGFINFIVKPSYEVLGDIIPEVGKVVLPILKNNLMYWEDQKWFSDNQNMITRNFERAVVTRKRR